MNHFKILFLLALTASLSSCKWNQQTVVVAGDSWALFTCVHKSLDQALTKAGLKNAKANATCVTTSDPGARAENWRQSRYHQNVLLALKDPTVRVLYLSLGGNDVINYWNKNLSGAQTEQVILRTRQYVADIVSIYHAERPDIKILVTGYDFPRFTSDHPILAYRRMFEDMGLPSPQELNSALVKMSESFYSLNEMNQTRYVHHLGVMHYHFGNKEMGLAPKTTRAPQDISKPGSVTQSWGGDLKFQSDVPAMQVYTDGDYVGVVDAFHLSKQGYHFLADHSVELYIKNWLNGSVVTE
jgi:hypothetical protein